MSGAARRLLLLAPALVLLLLAAREAPPPGGPSSGAAARLVGRMLFPSPLIDDLRFLSDRIGGRPTGGAACERAVDWFADRFREAGADRVMTEAFTMPRRWEEGASRLRVTSPEPMSFEVAAMPYSPDTPAGGRRGALVDLQEGGAPDLARAGGALRGAFGLVSSEVILTFGDLFGDYMRLPPLAERARAAGAAGLLFIGARERRVLYRHVATFGDEAPLPMAILPREDGLRLARLAAGGAVAVNLDLAVTSGPAYEARNVIAEITGRERPEEIVLAGAHLDSWDLGSGALDNGANCALLLDIARQIAASEDRPRRTIRVVLFTGEEQGLHGSLAYARAHRAELDRMAAAVIFDVGTGRITGFSLTGREDLRRAVEEALRPVEGYGASEHTADAYVGTDNFDFLLEGVPNLVANQDPANYMQHYHAATDTFDKADLRELKINAAIAAALIWGLADSPGRAPRLARAGIQSILETTGADEQMKTFGLWESWAAGRRGRPE